jgi:tRNA(fMet)-specific endonuclease VapC
VILDTNALSAFIDGDAGVGEILKAQTQAAIPVIVLGEFRYGIAQSRHRSAYEAWLDSELRHFEVLAVNEETATAYAGLRVALKRSGRPIPANDAWIAALALQHGLPILSRDGHFDVVPNLKRKAW